MKCDGRRFAECDSHLRLRRQKTNIDVCINLQSSTLCVSRFHNPNEVVQLCTDSVHSDTLHKYNIQDPEKNMMLQNCAFVTLQYASF